MAVVLIIPGNIFSLIDFFSFTAWLFYGATMACVLILRCTRPNDPRPYRVSSLSRLTPSSLPYSLESLRSTCRTSWTHQEQMGRYDKVSWKRWFVFIQFLVNLSDFFKESWLPAFWRKKNEKKTHQRSKRMLVKKFFSSFCVFLIWPF